MPLNSRFPASASSERRYGFVRELGRGGMGSVALVYDSVRQEHVALKRILEPASEALVRFKREFRAIEQKLHPNLIRLHELDEDAQGLFFTMALVDGVDVLSFCRDHTTAISVDSSTVVATRQSIPTMRLPEFVDPAQAPTELGPGREGRPPPGHTSLGAAQLLDARVLHRLNIILPQLLGALSFLHATSIVHRDLKPSNIMVTTDGQLKLLDFGVLAELDSMDQNACVGTPGYMAPEQFSSAPATPASDMYSIGVLLFEILTGELPFGGEDIVSFLRAVQLPPPRLCDRVEGAPPALEQLVAALLSRDPHARPTAEHALRFLGFAPHAAVESSPVSQGSLWVGRDDDLRDLLEVANGLVDRGQFGMVVLQAPTGSGKTTIAERLASALEPSGVIVLRGRGRSTERVPFNVVDRALDQLALHLHQPGLESFVSANQRLLKRAASVFPVLGSSCAPAQQTTRQDAFTALQQVLSALAGRRGAATVLLADDLQWADEDSLALVEHMLDTQPPNVIIVATLRNDVGANGASELLARRRDVQVIALPPLSNAAIRTILRASARDIGVELSDDLLEQGIRACDGRPMLAELAGRMIHRAENAEGLTLEGVIGQLPSSSRTLLTALAAADDWLEVDLLVEVTRINPGEVMNRLEELANERLIRRERGAGSLLGRADIYHDAIRVALLSSLAAEETRQAHRALATSLLNRPSAQEHRLVRHLLAAGEPVEAAKHAWVAAQRAQAQRAYALAADMYAVALLHPGNRRLELLRLQASVLQDSGRYLSAAECWEAIANESPNPDVSIDARLNRVHALLAGGSVVDGDEQLRESLRQMGDSPTLGPIHKWLSAAAFALGPVSPKAVARRAYPGAEARGAERDARIGMMLGLFEPLEGIVFLQRARHRYARAGVIRQAAWCDYLFAYFAINGSHWPGRVMLSDRYRRRADGLVKQLGPDPLLEIMPPFLEGCQLMRAMRWDAADVLFQSALERVEEQGLSGTFEHLYILHRRVQLELHAQRPTVAAQRVAKLRETIGTTAGTAMRAHLAGAEMSLKLLTGQFERAQELIDVAQRLLPAERPTLQGVILDIFRCLPALYLSDCHGLPARIVQALRNGRRFRPLRQWVSGHLCSVAALVEANALRTGDAEASCKRLEWYARRATECVQSMPGAPWRARAYVADIQDRRDMSIRYLEKAERASLAVGQLVDVAIARYQRALRVGGAEGELSMRNAYHLIESVGSSPRLLHEDAGMRND